MSSEPTAVSAQKLSIDYGKTRVVDEVSFSVKRGEIFVIMGQSGCGKSTLLKTIGGYIKPSGGELLVNGRPVGPPGPDRMVVWQDLHQLFYWKTVVENVAYPLLIAGQSKKQARETALNWIERVGLTRAQNHFPHQLSGGMQQRVALARGFAANPAALLLDEPFSALDALSRHRLQEEVISLQRQSGTTVLFVSHDVNEAARVGDRILVLSPHPGRVKSELVGGSTGLADALRDLIHDEGSPEDDEEEGVCYG